MKTAKKVGQIFNHVLDLTAQTALLCFFGIWMVRPPEILASMQNHTLPYLVFGIELIVGLSFLITRVINKKNRLDLISFIASSMSFIALIGLFFNYIGATATLWESWMVQFAWYIRLNGFAIGLFLGFSAGSIYFNMILFLLNLHSADKTEQKFSISIFMILFAFHLSIIHFLFSQSGFLPVVIYLLIIQTIAFTFRFFLFLPNEANQLNQNIKSNQINQNQSGDLTDQVNSDTLMGQPGQKIEKLVTLLVFLPVAIVLAYFIIFDNDNLVILAALPLAILLVNFWTLGNIKRKKYFDLAKICNLADINNKKRILITIRERTLGLLLGIFEVFRIGIILAYIATPLYLFKIPFYAPMFFAKAFGFGITGAIIYLVVRKYETIQRIVFLCFVASILSLMVVLNRDVLLNLYSYYDESFDMIFPFQILLSDIHAAVVGASFGFIISYELNRIFTRALNVLNIPWRALTIMIVFIVFGYLIGSLSFTNILGGQISSTSYTPQERPFTPNSFLELPFSNIFWVWLAIGIAFILLEFIIPMIIKRMRLESKSLNQQTKEPTGSAASNHFGNPDSFKDSRESDLTPKPLHVSRIKSFSSLIKKQKIIAGILLASFLISLVFIPTQVSSINNAYSLQLASRSNGFDVYIAPSYIRIGPTQWIQPKNIHPDASYTLSMARNEYEDFQLIIAPRYRTLNNLRYIISNLNHDNGVDSISSENIQVRYVENVINEQFPDKLVPFSYLHLIEQRNHNLWVTVFVPYSANPGRYSGIVNFTFGDAESFAIQLNLNVWNFTVPNMRHFRSNFGPQTFEPSHIATFISHRINSYGIPISRAPSIEALNAVGSKYTCYLNTTTDQWQFNWTFWDEQTEAMINQGANAFYINSPLGMPRDPIWYEPNSTIISKWGNQTANFYKEARDHLIELRDMHGKNWLPYVYIYFIDEWQMFIPKPYTENEYIPLLAGFLEMINNSAPEFKIMTTSPPRPGYEAVRKYIDIYCPITSDYNKTEWDAAMAEGKEMWMYPCVGPTSPWPNSHLYNRLYEIRVLYWQAYYYGLQGFLYWSTNAYYHGNYGMAYNSWGDGWFVYQDNAGNTFDSIRWQNWRDAAEDYEYLWLMNATITLRGNKAEDKALLQRTLSEITGEKYLYCNSGDVIVKNRQLIGDWLSQIQSSGEIDIVSLGELPWYPN